MQNLSPPYSKVLGREGGQPTLDLLELLWRNRVAVIVCAGIGILIGFAYYALAPRTYESSAEVLVVQKRPQAVTGDIHYESGFEDYLATHLAIMVSPVIVERAIETADLAALSCFADIEDPETDLADAIIDNLEVAGGSRDLGENADSIMTVYYRCNNPEDAPVVVQALLSSYESFHQEIYRGMSDSTVELIDKARDLLENDLASQEQAYSDFRQQSPLVANGSEEINPLQNRLANIELRRSELLLRKAEVASQVRTLERVRQSGADDQQLLSRVYEMRQQAAVERGLPEMPAAIESQLVQLIDSKQELREYLGPDHPHVLSMEQRIEDLRQLFALPSAAHRADATAESQTAPKRGPVDVYDEYLRQELASLEAAETQLSQLYESEHGAAKEHSTFQLKDMSLQRGIERTETLYDVIIARLQEASLVKDYGGFETTVIAPPRLGMKVSPRGRIVLPVAAFAGVLLGCVLAVGWEIRNDRFHSCDQVQQQLDVPVIGSVPDYSTTEPSGGPEFRIIAHETSNPSASGSQDQRIDPMICTWARPRSAPAEAFRALRTALGVTSAESVSRVIQVTGTDIGDGASTVTANLATSIAQAGKRVLIVEADFCQQRQLDLFGIECPETGLASIIRFDSEPIDAIQSTAVENLSLLPLGAVPQGPCELFTSRRFSELIAWARDTYDYVIIDTEPLSTASDPLAIAPLTDEVILLLRLDRDSRSMAIQAKRMLARVGVRNLSVLVNRAPRRSVGHSVLPFQSSGLYDSQSADAAPKVGS